MTTHRYSYSQISTYAACPLKYKLRYLDYLMPIQEGGRHDLDFGGAMHDALAVLYGPQGSVKAAHEAFASSYPESQYPDSLPMWSQGKSFAGGLAAIGAYANHYRDEDRYWQVLSVERMNTSDDGEERRLVRLDLVVRDTRDDMVYGIDNKITGKYLDANYWAAFDPHSQIRQYVDHLQKKYGECGGFYINALSLRHRQKAYTPRSGPQKGIQLPAGDWCEFKRMCFNPNAEAVEAERDSMSAWIHRIEQSKETNTWGYNTDHCVRGPIFCEYHQMCSAGYAWPRDRQLIEAHYRQQCIRLAKSGERCQLEPGHEGEHDSTRPQAPEFEIEIAEDNIEDGVAN
jgi:hypothetical protein